MRRVYADLVVGAALPALIDAAVIVTLLRLPLAVAMSLVAVVIVVFVAVRARASASGPYRTLSGLVFAPLDVAVAVAWILSPLLLLTPLLIGSGPVAVGPVEIGTAAGAWLTAGVGVVIIVAGVPAVLGLSAVHAAVDRLLPADPDSIGLQHQVRDLTSSRLRIVDAFDVERRRIERDLHDGAQQNLVALAMTLDLARVELEDDPHPAVEQLINTAHADALNTLRGLRELIAGIHPPVLTEQGLPAAVQSLADRAPLPVEVRSTLAVRLSPHVESTAYFVVAEALTNAVKHSGAEHVDVVLATSRRHVVVSVTDDGRGGADPEAGSGLTGLADRLAAVGGRLSLTSGPGGPTRVQAEMPVREPSR